MDLKVSTSAAETWNNNLSSTFKQPDVPACNGCVSQLINIVCLSEH